MPSLQLLSLGEQGLRDRRTNPNEGVDRSIGNDGLVVDELTISSDATRTHSDSKAIGTEQGCDLDALERRMSLNSNSVIKDLQYLARRCTLESTWVRAMLLSTGGLDGGEQAAMKLILLIIAICHAICPPTYAFLIGWPMPLCGFFLSFYMMFLLPAQISRRYFLQSGLLQWLIDSTKHKDILDRFDISCRSLFLGTALEGMVLNITASLVVVHDRVRTDRFDMIFGSARWLFLVCGLSNSILHFVRVLIAKQLPMFLSLTCDVLVADLRHFHRTIDVLFRNQESRSDACLLEQLQKHECSLRIRLAAANKIILQMVLVILLTNLLELLGCLLLFFSSLFVDTPVAVAAIMLFLVLQHCAWLVSALRNIACVRDEWHHIVEEFNTPCLCSATSMVLGGISLDDRLGRLRYMGITVLEHTITSSTVVSVMFTIGSGLFLTALGIVLQIQFE